MTPIQTRCRSNCYHLRQTNMDVGDQANSSYRFEGWRFSHGGLVRCQFAMASFAR